MINSTQKKYLEERLSEVARRKLDKFSQENPQTALDNNFCYEMIANKKVKLNPIENIKKGSFGYVTDFFDFSAIREANQKITEKYNAYKEKLNTEKGKVMDAVILEGTGLAEALERFEEIE